MVRKLKHHEQKLLRRVDLTTPYTPSSNHAHALLRRYHITTPSTLDAYSRIVGAVHQLATRLTRLPPDDGVRVRLERALCEKLFDLGVLDTKPDGAGGAGLSRVVRKVGVGALVRRRLAVVMVRAGLCAGGVKAATRFIEQGHVRVGTEVVTDPAYLVTRNMQDFITWVDSSKIKRSVRAYRNEVDDFDGA